MDSRVALVPAECLISRAAGSQSLLPPLLLNNPPSPIPPLSLSGPSSYSLGTMWFFPLKHSPTDSTVCESSPQADWLGCWEAEKEGSGLICNISGGHLRSALLPLYENNYSLNPRPHHCRAGENSATLSISRLKPDEGHSLIEVSQIVAGEDAATKGCDSRRLWFEW